MLGRAAYHTPYLLHSLDVAGSAGRARSRGDCCAPTGVCRGATAHGVLLKHTSATCWACFASERGGRAFRQVLSEGAHKPGADWSLVERALACTESFEHAA